MLFSKSASGVENTKCELMSATRFCTTPKIDLQQHYYMFRDSYPLVTKVQNTVCYRLGTMLYLEIQND